MEDYARKLDAWHVKRRTLLQWPIWVAMFSVYLAIPSSIALVISGDRPELVRAHDRFRYATRDEQVRMLLRHIESRGPAAFFSRRDR